MWKSEPPIDDQLPPLDLRLTEESPEDLYELAPCGYCSFLPDGTVVKINRTLLDWLGYEYNEVVARMRFQELFAIGARLHYETHCLPLMLLEGEVREVSYSLRGRDGYGRPVLLHARMLRDDNGSPLVVRATLFDITERHRYEQVLLEARAQAERQQHQLTVQNERLLRSNADLDSFVYAASHDLKQPLNNMAGLFSELRRTAVFRDPDAVHMAHLFEEALADVLRTIGGLTEVVQFQRELDPVAAAPVELNLVVPEVLATLQSQVQALNARIDFDFDSVPTLCMAGPALRSVVYNLLSNALKYARPGHPPHLRLRSVLVEGFAVLHVSDNGRGLDLVRHGADLFQLFRRFHPDVEGSGTGLYLVNRLVQQAGGRVEVQSVVNEGTTFSILLPI